MNPAQVGMAGNRTAAGWGGNGAEASTCARSWVAVAGLAGLAMWVLWQLGFPARMGAAGWGCAALLAMVVRDAREEEPGLDPAEGRGWRVLTAVSAMGFGAGAWVDSASAQLMGLGGVLLGALAHQRGWRALGGLPLLIGLICLPQGVLRDTVLVGMQGVAAAMASWGLDLLDVPHLAQGAVLETPRGDLFVEEACSGMRSLVTGLTFAQAWFCLRRIGIGRSAAGLAAAALLLVGTNCARILTTALLQAGGHEAWVGGLRHDLIGWAWFLVAMGMVVQLPRVLTEGFRRCCGRSFPLWDDALVAGSGPQAARPVGEALRDLAGGLPRTTRVAVAGMVAALALEAWAFGVAAPTDTDPDAGVARLAAAEMPADLEGWHHDEAAAASGFLEGFSLHQRRWLFRKGPLRAWLAADLPFAEIHPLPMCYLARDWHVLRQESLAPQGVAGFSVLELRAKHGERPPLLVLFDHYDLVQGRFAGHLPGRLASRWETIRQRLAGPGASPTSRGPYGQIQVVLEGCEALESVAGSEALRLFVAARERLAASLGVSPSNPTLR